jgi:cyclopropane fatty-acyl-phospholipid synthase-like methyltransferase
MPADKGPWDQIYGREKRIWGDQPSELAMFACTYLKESTQFQNRQDIFILDLGCGYGRDAVFLAQNLPCHILGIDNSVRAIEMARESLPAELAKKIEFLPYDFSRVSDKYDIIFISNLYQILRPDERERLRETVKRCLNIEGLLFLSTFSVRDTQHSSRGVPVEDEPHSYLDKKYIHLSTRAELEADFKFLHISALFEREFYEVRSSENHHHISWILMGKTA